MDEYKCDVCEVLFKNDENPPVVLSSITGRRRTLCSECYENELLADSSGFFDQDYTPIRTEDL